MAAVYQEAPSPRQRYGISAISRLLRSTVALADQFVDNLEAWLEAEPVMTGVNVQLGYIPGDHPEREGIP